MNFDIPKRELPADKREVVALDEQWYERFEKVGNFKILGLLDGDKKCRDGQKNDFLNQLIENPKLDYPDLENFNFDEKELALLQLKEDVLNLENDEIIKQVYRWKINEKIASLRMLRCAKNGDQGKFKRYSEYVFGKPEKDIFLQSLIKVKSVVDSRRLDADQRIIGAITRLDQNLKIPEEIITFTDVSNYEFPKLKSTSGELEYGAEEIKSAFQEAILKYNTQGWEIIIDESGKLKNINVNQENKTVNVPGERKVKETKLKALIAHEIGTHVLRRENGERSKLKLLGLGLDRYTKGEEGLATHKEQEISGMTDFAGFDGHLAISLAEGLDGTQRNFREVFDILRDYYFIKSKNTDIDKAWENAQESAWSQCVRVFRGTSCETRGVCFTKDIAYREGNIGIWNLVKRNDKEMQRVMVGKYDPTSERHIWILDQLGISEDDLKTLEK
jgi:hypothetical protein